MYQKLLIAYLYGCHWLIQMLVTVSISSPLVVTDFTFYLLAVTFCIIVWLILLEVIFLTRE